MNDNIMIDKYIVRDNFIEISGHEIKPALTIVFYIDTQSL